MATTTKAKEKHYRNWKTYAETLGVDATLVPETTLFHSKCRTIMGFRARVPSEYYGHGRQVAAGSVSQTFMVIGLAISMDQDGSGKYIYPVSVMMKGLFGKQDPDVVKKLSVEVKIPEFLVKTAAT